MFNDLEAVYDRICRRNLYRGLRDSPTGLLPAADVVLPLAALIDELGDIEATKQPYDGPNLTLVARLGIKTICHTESLMAMRILDEEGRNAVRGAAQGVLRSVRLMALADKKIGPIPRGIEGQSLGFATLALGILEPKAANLHLYRVV